MSVKMTHIYHVYKHNHNANLMHQQSALTKPHLSQLQPRYVCK